MNTLVAAPLRITDFSPNCLMGSCEAIARSRLEVPNFNRLFYNCSFAYNRAASGLDFAAAPVLNSSFSRSLPLEKPEFLQRLSHCYGISLSHKGYDDFETLLADIDRFAAQDIPVISEIDLFFMPGHPFCGNTRDGHMMILGGKGHAPDTLSVLEAVFGWSELPLASYLACFEDRRHRGRPFYLMHVSRDAAIDNALSLPSILADLSASIDNLNSDTNDKGLSALKVFSSDIVDFLKRVDAPFIVPGFWTLMCTYKNNLRFLAALDPSLTAGAHKEVTAMQRQMAWLYKRWFLLNLSMETSVSDDDFKALAELPQLLATVFACEEQTPDLIAALRHALEKG
ncbi:MAG: hypothetical protein GY717_05740 [Rhodobacteraceae bacterium]|nr:hypothetical protein [Paracoccaceae bacterium]